MKKHALALSLCVASCLALSSCGGGTPYATIDRQQATEEHYQSIVEYMDTYLENLGYFPVGYSVEWIGYYKYEDMYDVEEYETMELGGYYAYTGQLATGETANADISTYWGEGEDPVILNLNIETLDSENPIIPFDNDSIVSCWNTYYQKANAS